jgi:hypothetical protein
MKPSSVVGKGSGLAMLPFGQIIICGQGWQTVSVLGRKHSLTFLSGSIAHVMY